MKKRMILLFGSILVISITVSYYLFYDNLPPRTPLKIARNQSTLNIPKNSSLMDFKEVYSFNGDGEIYVKFKMDAAITENIVKESKLNNYRELTIKNLINDKLIDAEFVDQGYNIQGQDISLIKDGYYKLEANNLVKNDFSITIIDVAKMELIVYISIP